MNMMNTRPNAVAAMLLLLLWISGTSLAQVPRQLRPPNDATDTYEVKEMRGWTIRLSHRLKPHEDLKKEIIEEVDVQLRKITQLVNAKVLAELRKTEIWIEHGFPGRTQYHNDKGWLDRNGYNTDKTGTVEIADPKEFLAWKDRAVLTMLHELMHAYHHKVLGWNEPRVIAAFKAAEKSGKYEKIMRDKGYTIKHYALSNHKEYFAEAAEAYFWCNDYYPFVYGELKEFDPKGFALMEEIFGKRFEDDPRVHPEAEKKE